MKKKSILISALRLVDWVMRGEIWKLLGRGCRVWLTPAPFDHAKLFVVDGVWSLVGSANWDPRSLRLNFELGLECYDAALARDLDALIDDKITTVDAASRWVRPAVLSSSLTLTPASLARSPRTRQDHITEAFAACHRR